jgi:hypothetical protein
MLTSSVQLGVVVDEHDAVIGLISVDAISEALRAPSTRSHGDGAPARRAAGADPVPT